MEKLFVLTLLAIGFVGGQIAALSVGFGARITLLDGVVMMTLLYGAYRRERKRFIPRLWAPVLGFFGVTLVSLLLTRGEVPVYVLGGGLLYVIRWILYAALYWVAAAPLVSQSAWLTLLSASGSAIGLLGLVQYVWYPDLRNLSYLGWDPHYQRLFSTLLDPNFSGIILAVTALTMLGTMRKDAWLFVRVAGLAVSVVSLLLTYSRSSLISFGVGLCVWGILTKRTALVAGCVAAVLSVLFIMPHAGEGRNLWRTASSYARFVNAGRAFALIREKPWFGHGFNIVRFVSMERGWIDETRAPARAGAGFDMSALFIGVTTGIIGIATYGWMIVRLLMVGISGLGKSKTVRGYAAVYVATTGAILVHGLFVNSLFYPWVMVWMWVSTGVMEQYLRADR